jgi:hypothetical protein
MYDEKKSAVRRTAVRRTALPQIRRQGRVEMFGPIKVVNRCRNVPQLKVGHAALYIILRMTRLHRKVLRQTL